MLYWRSNTWTIACIDYTNGALDGACYIGGATLTQQHLLIIPLEHWTKHVILAEQHLNNSMYWIYQRSIGRSMLYWWSNTRTTACIDYTNGALNEACYIGGVTLEQQHVLIIPMEHWTEHVILVEQHWNSSMYWLYQWSIGQSMLYWWSNIGTAACIDYTNGALGEACYIGGATLEQQHLLIIPMEHWTEHVILVEQHWNNSMYWLYQRSILRSMLCWHSNTGTTTSIDYTNGALDGACYIGRATLEQQHRSIIPTEHWAEHVMLAE